MAKSLDDIEELKADIKKFNVFADYVESSCPELALNFEESSELPQDQFRDWYHKLMKTYELTNNWWKGVTPECQKCHKDITDYKDLRVLDSTPYHPDCFKKVFDSRIDPDDSPLMTQYWQKVLKL